MILGYSNSNDRKLCENERYSREHLGKDVSDALFDLIDEIIAAKDLSDIEVMPQYRLHPLHGNKKELFSLTPIKRYKYRVEFYPLDENNQKLICKTDLHTFYKTVKNIKITNISEHYD